MRPASGHRLVGLAIVAWTIGLLGGCGQVEAPEPIPASTEESPPSVDATATPDILLVVVDALRKDRLGCYGHPIDTSPAIDDLASVSTLYLNAHSQAPWTIPSVASLLTSRYPSSLGIRGIEHRLGDEALTLPEVLRQAGYRTAAVTSHRFLTEKWGFHQGFDTLDASPAYHTSASAPEVTQRAIELLETDHGRPVFLLAHYFDPHFPYVMHEGFDPGNAATHDDDLHPALRDKRSLADLEELQAAGAELGPADVSRMLAIYDSEVAFTDHHIGRLLDRLRETGRFDETLIVFTADHGEAFLERGWIGHENSLHAEVTGVPLLIKLPAASRPVVEERDVALVDVYPTVLDVLGIEPTWPVAGHGLLDGTAATDARSIFAETARLGTDLRSVVRNRLKLIRDVESGGSTLYDLARDPRERTDLSELRPAVAAELAREIEQWMARTVEDGLPGTVELSEHEREALRSLGYVE